MAGPGQPMMVQGQTVYGYQQVPQQQPQYMMMQPGQQMQYQNMVVEPVMMTQPLQNNTLIISNPADTTPDKQI